MNTLLLKPKTKGKTMRRKTKKEDDDESTCEIDGRLDACEKNTKREHLLWKCLKGTPVEDTDLDNSFACGSAKVRTMVASLVAKYSELPTSIVQIGGQGNNYDYTFHQAGTSYNIELKTNKLASKHDVLKKVPWSAYGQLLQIFLNVKDVKYKPLFESFDTEGMIRAWFDTVVLTTIVPKYGIEGEIRYDSYYTLLFKTAAAAAKQYDNESLSIGARNLFRYFHEHRTKEDNAYRANLWKKFCKTWMDGHVFDAAHATSLLQATLNKKHIWICTTSNDAYIIEGPKCESMTFERIKTGKDASVLVYKTKLLTPSTGVKYDVDMEFRFYWKNGGQGVHNLCLQIS